MNRRNFFKVVTGFVAGIFATSAKSEPKYSCSASASGHPSAENSVEPKDDWIDVQYFGVRDNTKLIQEAIDLAKDGGVVYFPKGTYNLKYSIIV